MSGCRIEWWSSPGREVVPCWPAHTLSGFSQMLCVLLLLLGSTQLRASILKCAASTRRVSSKCGNRIDRSGDGREMAKRCRSTPIANNSPCRVSAFHSYLGHGGASGGCWAISTFNRKGARLVAAALGIFPSVTVVRAQGYTDSTQTDTDASVAAFDFLYPSDFHV